MWALKWSLTCITSSSLRLLGNNRRAAVCQQLHRSLSTQTDGEVRIANILKEKFPTASSLKVVDISGGCGAMYEIHVESNEFKGKRTVQQHQLVNQALKDEIQEMHGLRIFTAIPES
ncbi:bolA-like protein 3 [Cynoglossus semilaevis]|uniref:BolA-like protein 3 n=1 Tax=Cynoglossus semilaevis TaxID=244447 RepID=A0A3P8WVK7_CYNSE|nr:bolA-like protein 3 [Cynoglossus semilaevis]